MFMTLPTLLPAEKVPLGSLVYSVLEPHIDTFNPKLTISEENAYVTVFESVKAFNEASSSQKASLALTQLLNAHLEPGKSSEDTLESKTVRKTELTVQAPFFSKICKREDGIEWLDAAIANGEKVYMVVGLMTVLDAAVSQSTGSSHDIGAEVTIPVGTALTGGADFLGMLNPSIGASTASKKTNTVSFIAPGEKVWALAYRRITFRAFHRKSLSTIQLDKTIHWTPMTGQRSSTDEEESIAAELGDLDMEEDDELEGLDGDGEFYIAEPAT